MYGREAYEDYIRNYENAEGIEPSNHYRTLEEQIDEMDEFGTFEDDELEMLTWEE